MSAAQRADMSPDFIPCFGIFGLSSATRGLGFLCGLRFGLTAMGVIKAVGVLHEIAIIHA